MTSYQKRGVVTWLSFLAYYLVFGCLAVGFGLAKNGWAFMGIFIVGAVWALVDQRLEAWRDAGLDDRS